MVGGSSVRVRVRVTMVSHLHKPCTSDKLFMLSLLTTVIYVIITNNCDLYITITIYFYCSFDSQSNTYIYITFKVIFIIMKIIIISMCLIKLISFVISKNP